MRKYRWGILTTEYLQEYDWRNTDKGNTNEGFGFGNTSPFTAALFEAISLTRLETSSEGDRPPFSTWGILFCNWDKYNLYKYFLQNLQIYLIIWTNLLTSSLRDSSSANSLSELFNTSGLDSWATWGCDILPTRPLEFSGMQKTVVEVLLAICLSAGFWELTEMPQYELLRSRLT